MSELFFTIVGMSEYNISFENYCVPCKWQARCRYGKKNPLSLVISCNNLLEAYETKRYDLMKKAQKEADIEDTYEQIEARVKVNMNQIFSGIWKKLIKLHKEEILCLNSRKMDPMVTAQRGGEWWSEFARVMKEIYNECRKQVSIKG